MNIHYQTPAIADFYSENRVRWAQLYESEQFVFERVFEEHGDVRTVLDAGCACGGLGRALHERFGIGHYTGIDVNASSIERARSDTAFPTRADFECGDIAADPACLRGRTFDVVVSLSCADWNCDTAGIVKACWDRTAEGGYFVLSFRLTNQRTVNDIASAYQWVKFDEGALRGDEEKAPYVVTNVHEMLAMVNALRPKASALLAYGYWGRPSAVAVLPYEKVVFSVLAVQKRSGTSTTASELLLPLDLYVDPNA